MKNYNGLRKLKKLGLGLGLGLKLLTSLATQTFFIMKKHTFSVQKCKLERCIDWD